MNIVAETEKDFIEKIIDVMAIGLPAENQLAPPEKRFLVECVALSWNGYDIGSRSAVVELNRIFGWSKNSRYVYKFRGYLKDKKWLDMTAYGIHNLPPTLAKRLPSEITITMTISRQEKDGNNSR